MTYGVVNEAIEQRKLCKADAQVPGHLIAAVYNVFTEAQTG